MIVTNTTDALLSKSNVRVLEDDQRSSPRYEASLLVRRKVFSTCPNLGDAMRKLAGKITVDGIRQMNYEVDISQRSAKSVATGFLQGAGFLRR